jgi:hypothetical protein
MDILELEIEASDQNTIALPMYGGKLANLVSLETSTRSPNTMLAAAG